MNNAETMYHRVKLLEKAGVTCRFGGNGHWNDGLILFGTNKKIGWYNEELGALEFANLIKADQEHFDFLFPMFQVCLNEPYTKKFLMQRAEFLKKKELLEKIKPLNLTMKEKELLREALSF